VPPEKTGEEIMQGRIMMMAAVLCLLATAAGATDSAIQLLDRHITTIKKGDLDGVMADYADNALLIAPHGIVPGQTDVSGNDVFSGKANIRKFFAVLTDKEHNPAVRSMVTRFESRGNDVILMHWTQFKGTPQQVNGTDTWVIRSGKVITQVVAVEPAKK
jgi:ketosteroid isomerase-like protein